MGVNVESYFFVSRFRIGDLLAPRERFSRFYLLLFSLPFSVHTLHLHEVLYGFVREGRSADRGLWNSI
jgi:hypothetical protein